MHYGAILRLFCASMIISSLKRTETLHEDVMDIIGIYKEVVIYMIILTISKATGIVVVAGTIVIGGGLIVQTINQIYKDWTDSN